MDNHDYSSAPYEDGLTAMWRRMLRLARNLAIAGALAGLGGIMLGATLTDGWVAQIFVTLFAAAVLWVPMLGLTLWVSRLLGRKRAVPGQVDVVARPVADPLTSSWRRLSLAAPGHRNRIVALEQSLGRSRSHLGDVAMDSDAHELCAMIDRRLPDLIDHELDSLAPDSRGRDRQVGELVELVEQFVRHCGAKRDGAAIDSAYHAEVLKRRFEMRLADDRPFDH